MQPQTRATPQSQTKTCASNSQSWITKLCEVESSEAVTPFQRLMKAWAAAVTALVAGAVAGFPGVFLFGMARMIEAGRMLVQREKIRHMKTLLLYVATAVAEIVGCYLPWLWLRQGASVWLLLPAAASLALFAWLLTLHDAASGRVYAAYGGVYIGVALAWLWAVDGVRPSAWDAAGVALALAGMGIIAFQPR